MSKDRFESLAVIPNPTDNFDEVWVVVKRANGRFVERMVRRLKETTCGGTTILLDEQVFLDSTISFDEGKLVTQITATNGTLYTITSAGHGYENGDTVRLRNVEGAIELSNTTWTITNVTTDTFQLATRIN